MNRILTFAAALVLLALPGLALADYNFDWSTPDTEAVEDVGIIHQFHTTLSNTGSDADTYIVSLQSMMPDSWTATMCEGATCYPPFITEITVNLAGGASTNLDIDVTALEEGVGTVFVSVTNQNGAGSQIMQDFTLTTTGANTASFEFDTPDLGAVVAPGIVNAFHTSLTNTGSETDTYTISMVKDHAGDWVSSMCEGATCYPPFITEITVTLGPDELTNLDIDVTPGSVGDGSVTITITSQNTPSLTDSRTFGIVTTGLDLLVVNGEPDYAWDSYYVDAVTAAGKSSGVWHRWTMGSLSNDEISAFPTVVWLAGDSETGGIGIEDFGALSYHIMHGGGFFLSGQHLAGSFCDPGSPHYSSSSVSWFNTVLGCDYQNGALGAEAASGVPGDLLTDGMQFNLFGGDGADNNLGPERLEVTGNGTACLTYDGIGGNAAVRNNFNSGYSVFCGFAFEGIDTAAHRNALMSQVLDWFSGNITSAGDLLKPVLAGVPYASPNPFNPQTSIKFEVGGDVPVNAMVDIYDLRGQKVRSLFQGAVNPGPNSLLWDGRTDDGRRLATGVYMARVNVGGMAETVKMSLVK